MRYARLIVVFIAGLSAGCAQSLGAHQVSLDVVQVLRGGGIPAMRVGTFALAPGRSASMDKGVIIRSVNLTSPDGGSFANYLGKALETDLRAAGKYDESSVLVVQGLLTDSDVNAGIVTGDGVLGARFSLLRSGNPIFEKEITVRSKWDSSYLGPVAIPAAVNQYSALYDKLVLQLLTDDDFKRAVAPVMSLDLPQ